MFPFDENENLAVFTCVHIMQQGHPILRVVHDEDGDWQFLCGGAHSESDAMLVSLKRVYEKDPSIGELASLPQGKVAVRNNPGCAWETAS